MWLLHSLSHHVASCMSDITFCCCCLCVSTCHSLIACAMHSQRISRSSSTAGHASTAAAAAPEASFAELAFATSFHQKLLESVLFEQQLKAQQDKQWDKILSKLDKVSKVSWGPVKPVKWGGECSRAWEEREVERSRT